MWPFQKKHQWMAPAQAWRLFSTYLGSCIKQSWVRLTKVLALPIQHSSWAALLMSMDMLKNAMEGATSLSLSALLQRHSCCSWFTATQTHHDGCSKHKRTTDSTLDLYSFLASFLWTPTSDWQAVSEFQNQMSIQALEWEQYGESFKALQEEACMVNIWIDINMMVRGEKVSCSLYYKMGNQKGKNWYC